MEKKRGDMRNILDRNKSIKRENSSFCANNKFKSICMKILMCP